MRWAYWCGMEDEPLLPQHGGYRKLKSFQLAQLCFDVTVRFCDRYIDRRSRTHDQMVQAARSGVQNIAEGSVDSGTSKKSELKLTNVARGSLEELRLDYQDYLRQHRLPEWPKDDPRRDELVARRCASADEVAGWIKLVARRESLGESNGLDGQNGRDGPAEEKNASMPSMKSMESIYAALAANAALVLLGVACSLLSRQVAAQAQAFEEQGGFTERLYRIRNDRRRNPPPEG